MLSVNLYHDFPDSKASKLWETDADFWDKKQQVASEYFFLINRDKQRVKRKEPFQHKEQNEQRSRQSQKPTQVLPIVKHPWR